jgi:hypothetical protein
MPTSTLEQSHVAPTFDRSKRLGDAPFSGPRLVQRVCAGVYVGTGDSSDTAVAEIARDTADDGRPLVMLSFADFDPSGHNMTNVLGRKLQAHACLPAAEGIEFAVIRAGLDLGQVQRLELPSSPLKDSPRARGWRAEMSPRCSRKRCGRSLRSGSRR